MKIIEIKERGIWEKFIKDNCPQALFSSWNWGEVSKHTHSRQESDFVRWGLVDKELTGICQIQKISARRAAFFHLRHGPILSKWTGERFKFLLVNVVDYARKLKVSFIRISPLIEDNQSNRNFFRLFGFSPSPIHRMDGEVCWVLDLNLTRDQLLLNMRKTTRYLIRAAGKSAVSIVKTTDEARLKNFLKLYSLTARRQKFIGHEGIREEFRQLVKDNQIMIFEGYYQKQLLSSALILFYNEQAIYHHSASIPSKIPVNYLLQWEVILEAKRRGMSVYNFWGIAPEGRPRHPWRNLSLFKKGFGGREVNYLHSQDLPVNNFKYRINYLIESYRKISKGY